MQQHSHRSAFTALVQIETILKNFIRHCDEALCTVGVTLRAFSLAMFDGRFLAAAQYFAQFCALGAVPPARRTRTALM
jgi:hypothetical protein